MIDKPLFATLIAIFLCSPIGSATGGEETDSLASGGGFESQLEQVRRLQAEVERLRTVVSDQFATQVCTSCNVQ